MRSYGQYCAAARALDVVGDRWNLLIIRELLLQGDCRYTDLLNGLPGIATNLLADRLRDLEEADVIYREQAPPPVATTLFRLTPRGRELEPVLLELIRWGAGLMAEPVDGEAFRSHWLAAPVRLYLEDRDPDQPATTIELRPDDQEPLTAQAGQGGVATHPGSVEQPDLRLAGTPQLILGLVTSALDLEEARARGLRCEGDVAALRRLQPEA